jgi:hypothetical protein
MKTLFKKARIFREQVKDRQTAHWDLDMLSRKELEALMSRGTRSDSPSPGENSQGSTERSE